MFEVLENDEIAPALHRMVVAAPRVARARRPGQFVIVRSEQGAERIPLTIADDDPATGTITLIIQAVGRSTKNIVSVGTGGSLRDVAGPLGQPTHIEKVGRVVCVGGGVGTAVLFPLAKALAKAGNHLTTIIGGRSEPYVVLRDELGEFSDEVICTTEDGSLGEKGFVTQPLKRILEGEQGERPAAVYADRSGADDAGRLRAHAQVRRQDHRLAQPDHGRRHRHVRRLPRDGRRRDQVRLRRRPRVRRPPGRLRRALGPPGGLPRARRARLSHRSPRSWRPELGHKELSAKERLAIPRVAMPEQDPVERAANFDEVNLGLTPELAILEAERCLQCKNRPCIERLPGRGQHPALHRAARRRRLRRRGRASC